MIDRRRVQGAASVGPCPVRVRALPCACVVCQYCRRVGTQRAWSFGRGCLSWLGRKDASLLAGDCGGTGTVPLSEGCASICTFTVHCILATRDPFWVFLVANRRHGEHTGAAQSCAPHVADRRFTSISDRPGSGHGHLQSTGKGTSL